MYKKALKTMAQSSQKKQKKKKVETKIEGRQIQKKKNKNDLKVAQSNFKAEWSVKFFNCNCNGFSRKLQKTKKKN